MRKKRTKKTPSETVEEEILEEELIEDTTNPPKDETPRTNQNYRKKPDYTDYGESVEEMEDDEEYEDDRSRKKFIIIAIIVSIAIALIGIFVYRSLSSAEQSEQNVPTEAQNSITESTPTDTEGSEAFQEIKDPDMDSEQPAEEEPIEEDSPDITSSPLPTATPKPLPTATPSPTPSIPEPTDSYVTSIPEDEDTLTVTTETADTVMIGDVRFREMANISSVENCGWVCSGSADYDWFVNEACTGADPMIGEGTKVFISIGLNDISRYTEYAVAISNQSAEWMERGAEVYFVAVGPVASDSGISNNDICTFNTYMYQNLEIPFIDAYNYLVENGFESMDDQSTSYTESTTLALYDYISQFS